MVSHVRLLSTPWTAACQASVLHHLPELAGTHVHRLSDAIQQSHPVVPFSSYLQSFPESGSFIRWPKYWSFSISPSNEYSGLISFRMDWFDLIAVQGTLKSFVQHTSETSILWRSAFLLKKLSHPYMTTGKTIALTIQTFCSSCWKFHPKSFSVFNDAYLLSCLPLIFQLSLTSL